MDIHAKKIISIIATFALISTAAMPCVYADTASDADAAASTTVEAAETTETAETAVTGDSTDYSLDDYANNDVLILYKDGSLDCKHYDSQESLAAGLAELASDDSVDTYQPNFSYTSDAVTTTYSTVNDTFYSKQWALKNNGTYKLSNGTRATSGIDINVEEAWDAYEAERDVIIAVIDTGIDRSNSEISNSLWVNSAEIAGNGIDDDGNGYVDDIYGWNFYDSNNVLYSGSDDDHGTHCAGTIAAATGNGTGIAGIASYDNIKIMNLKALGGEEGQGTTLSIVKAIRYAEEKGAKICNLSLGTSVNDPTLYKVMSASDMLFVVAAGNSTNASGIGSNTDLMPSYPASYNLDNIISVANLSANGRLHKSSDYGATTVDIAAPGTEIVSTISNGKYAYLTGTSMAAPMVTAVAALVYTGSSDITLDEVKDHILDTATTLSSLKGKVLTGGMLNAGAAVAYDGTADTGDSDSTANDGTDTDVTTNPDDSTVENPSSEPTSGSPASQTPQSGQTPQNGGYIQFPSFGGDMQMINVRIPSFTGNYQITFRVPSIFAGFFGSSSIFSLLK